MPLVEIYGPNHHPDDWKAEHVATLVLSDSYGQPGAHFHTHPREPIQVATTCYPAGHRVRAHLHPSQQRPAFGGPAQEVLIVQQGRLLCHFWDSEGRVAGQWVLRPGDVAILHGGGHSFEALEYVELVECKQGPFVAGSDKAYLFEVDEGAEHGT